MGHEWIAGDGDGYEAVQEAERQQAEKTQEETEQG